MEKHVVSTTKDYETLGFHFELQLLQNEPNSDLLAPVQTIFPELKMRAVVLGSRILIMTAAKR